MKKYFLITGVLAAAGIFMFYGCSGTQGNMFSSSSVSDEGKGWQIVVKRFYDKNQDQKAGITFESLIRVPGLDVQKVKKTTFTDSTVVTYGRYRSIDDPAAQKDMKFIKSLMIPNEGFPFYDSHLEPIPEPDPPIDPQWLISSANGFWTLQIAQFNGEKRKLAAVELVKQLRIEATPAYVFHGPVKSLVLIGAYPELGAKATKTGIKPVDRDLFKWKAKYPYMIVNAGYATLRKTIGKTKVAGTLESQIIKIPKPGGSLW